ncbi:MAG: Hint domain-containing protein [Pseudomonadota bacterium]
MMDSGARTWAATGFTAGTFAQTTRGLRPIERLLPGEDALEFRDGSTAPLLQLHVAEFSEADLAQMEDLRPVRIPPQSLGDHVPERTLTVAQSVHIHAQGRLVNRVTEHPEVLLPVSALVGLNGIEAVLPKGGVTYYHLVTQAHQVMRVEGLMSETLFLGEAGPLQDAYAALATHDAAAFPRLDRETAQRLTAKMARKNRDFAPEDANET